MITKVGLAQLPTLAFKNRHLIEQSTNVGCMYCGKIYSKTEIKNYTDNQKTCLCPHCNVDAVIGDNCGFDLNEKTLESANKYWYQKKS